MQEKNKPLQLTRPVPLVGQPEPVHYPIAGFALGFTQRPEEVAQMFQAAQQQGWMPDPGFVLAWQLTSLALAHLAAQNESLHARVKELEAKLGIEPPPEVSPEGLDDLDLSAFTGGAPEGGTDVG